MKRDTDGPYIVWTDYGVEGWKPTSYEDLADALTAPSYSSQWCITKIVKLEVLSDGKVLVG